MERYSIVYIDDKPEGALERYLDKEFHSDRYEVEFSDLVFYPEEGYESLLSNPKVRSANIILVDSWLFENRTANGGKFTGEEFKLVLKKFFPFIEVIVITQNGIESEITKIAKYDKSCGKTASEYYAGLLPSIIDGAVDNIHQYRLLAELINENDSWEKVVKEKVIDTLKGKKVYDELTKSDIDELIQAFREIQEIIDG